MCLFREWRYFNYRPRIVRFANDMGSCGEKNVLSEINLPQFSSAAVPKVRQFSFYVLLVSAFDKSLYIDCDVILFAYCCRRRDYVTMQLLWCLGTILILWFKFNLHRFFIFVLGVVFPVEIWRVSFHMDTSYVRWHDWIIQMVSPSD